MPFFHRKSPDWTALPWVLDHSAICPCCATPDRQRPKLHAPDGQDPLDRWQDKGLTPDDLRYLLEGHGHSLTGRI